MKDVSVNLSRIGNVGPVDTGRVPSQRPGVAIDGGFRDQLDALKNTLPTAQSKAASGVSALKFSNHAVERMQARGIRFSPEDMAKIESAVGKAEAKGAKNTLLLTDAAAMIVSIKDKAVVTVMDKANLKENVFTNIDSTVMI